MKVSTPADDLGLKIDSVVSPLDRGFNWRTLEKLLNSQYIRSVSFWLVLLPIAAKIVSELPESVELSPFGSEPPITLTLTLPFSWYIFYFSALLFFAARVLFLVFCPKFLLSFSSAGDAMTKGVTVQAITNDTRDFLVSYFKRKTSATMKESSALSRILSQYRLADEFSMVAGRHPEPIGLDIATSFKLLIVAESVEDSSRYVLGDRNNGPTIEKMQFFKHIFWDLERFQSISFPIVRLLCTILIILAFLLLAKVFLQTILFVIGSSPISFYFPI